MKIEEYDKKYQALKDKYMSDNNNLRNDFCCENNPYKKGDIIYDDKNKIRITDIKITMPMFAIYPTLVYHGIKLKSDGSEYKNKHTTAIFQQNIKGRVK